MPQWLRTGLESGPCCQHQINSLVPGRFEWNFLCITRPQQVNSKLVWHIPQSPNWHPFHHGNGSRKHDCSLFYITVISKRPHTILCTVTYIEMDKSSANKVNPGYFSLAATARKPQQLSMFLHISARVWGRRWSPHTSEQKGSMLKPR